MKQGMYAVWDKVALEFGPPFCAKNDDVAKRQYNHLVRSQELPVGEFELWRLGEYDTEKGITGSQSVVVQMFQNVEVDDVETV